MARASSSGLSSALRGGADTIVARATAPGRGALAVVRLSGDAVGEVLARVCPRVRLERAWRAQLRAVVGGDGKILDHAVVIPYRGPRSFTGEDMAELVVHGAPVVVEQVIEACLAAGARVAEPGEFSRRAFVNGKMDLMQAEGLRDLIVADTARQARLAMGQVQGDLSARVEGLRSALVELLARVEVGLDFPEEEAAHEEDELEQQRRSIVGMVASLLATAEEGRRLREGARVVLCGRPNSGKSTLFNVLLARERSIVSSRPGTTRDAVEAMVEMAGVPTVLVDTAGLSGGADEVEEESVRRAEAEVASADVVVLLWGMDEESPPEVDRDGGRKWLRVRSKTDLGSPREGAREAGWIGVSALSGEGVGDLRERLRSMVGAGVGGCGDSVAVGHRHRLALEEVREQLEEGASSPAELLAEHLRRALEALAVLSGEVSEEDVLDVVFRTFCLGK